MLPPCKGKFQQSLRSSAVGMIKAHDANNNLLLFASIQMCSQERSEALLRDTTHTFVFKTSKRLMILVQHKETADEGTLSLGSVADSG